MTIPEQKKPTALPKAAIIMPAASGPEELALCRFPKGANASALLFTLVETAKANEIDQQALLKFLFERFPAAQPPEDKRRRAKKRVDPDPHASDTHTHSFWLALCSTARESIMRFSRHTI
jgi:transposase